MARVARVSDECGHARMASLTRPRRDATGVIARLMMALAGGISSERRSLEEVHGSVAVPAASGTGQRLRRLFAFLGPAYLVSVGYMDPGNWATDLEGGARFGYALIWVLLMSNLMAMLLQTLAARLGVVTGHDLAQACRAEYSRGLNAVLWVLAEVAIAAMRPGRDPGNDHRAQAALRPAAVVGLSDHGLRHVPAPLFATLGNAADGGRDPGPGGDDRRLFPDPDLPGQAGHGGNCLGAAAELAAGVVVRGDRHPGRHGHAAQPVLALGPGSDPADRQPTRGASRRLAATT